MNYLHVNYEKNLRGKISVDYQALNLPLTTVYFIIVTCGLLLQNYKKKSHHFTFELATCNKQFHSNLYFFTFPACGSPL